MVQKTSRWPPPRIGPYKRTECILGPHSSSNFPLIKSITNKQAADIADLKKSGEKLKTAPAKPTTIEQGKVLDQQAENDVLSYKSFFSSLERWTHPVNVELLKPFGELLILAQMVKANCPAEEDFSGLGSSDDDIPSNSPIKLLRTQAQKVVEESQLVAKNFDEMTLALGGSSQPTTDKAAAAAKHLQDLQDGITGLGVTLSNAQDRLKLVMGDYNKYKAEADLIGTELAKKEVELDRVNDALDADELSQQYSYGESTFGTDITGVMMENDKQVLKISIGNIRTTLRAAQDHFDTAEEKKNGLDKAIRMTNELKDKLSKRVEMAKKVRKDASDWADTIRTLSTKYTVINSNIGIVADKTAPLKRDLASIIVPARAAYSKDILNVVDFGSMFVNRPGLLDMLRNICTELRKANDLEGANPSDQPDQGWDWTELKDRLEREDAHLNEWAEKIKKGLSEDEKMPQPLNFAKDDAWYIDAA